MRSLLALGLIWAALGIVETSTTHGVPPTKDLSVDVELLRKDVDKLLEAKEKFESKLSDIEKKIAPPARQKEQYTPPKLVPSSVATDTQKVSSPVAKYLVDTKPGHWTYPGDDIDAINGNRNELRHHLRTTHGANVDSMSDEQLLNMHDVLHEEHKQPVVPVQQVFSQPQQASYQPSVCPLGQPCPQRVQPTPQTQNYVQPRRQVFRRW